MARPPVDGRVDRLYELPPGEFTRERNALAKHVGGEEGRRIRALAKPSASAWAVNQLYWRDRATSDALVAASDRLRAAHRAVLGGKKADLVGADASHRDAVRTALVSSLRLAKESGQNVSATTHSEIARTLESLSSEDPVGRLAKPLSPEGFEALQGMPIRTRARSDRDEAAQPSRPAKPPTTRHLTLVKPRKDAERALAAARKRERTEQAAVAALEKRLAAAERATAVAKANWDRAQADEAKLASRLREEQRALEEAEAARRELEASAKR